MKAFKKLSVMILACLLMVSISGKTAFAASGTISLSDPTAAVGESVSVTVKVTTTDSSKIGSVTMELTYDPKILDFEEGTSATNEDGIVKISGTADTAIKTYTLTFKALSAGTSAIKISSYDIQDSKAATIEMSKVGSSTVTITGDGTTDATTTDTQTEDATTTDTQTEDATTTDAQTQEVQSIEDKIVNPPKKDVEVEIAGTPFYICKISKDIIPEGFEYIGYQYGDVAVDAVRKDNIVLFYLNQIGEEPYIFYLYDDETGGFYQYAPVTPALDYSVIDIDEGVVIPEGYTATGVSVGGVAVNGWQSEANSEYYLLYLMNSEGVKNLYSYDAVEKTVQRYASEVTATTTTDESTDSYQEMYTELNANYNSDMQSKTRLIYGLIVLAVVLVFLIINLTLRLSDKRHPIVEDDEEENDYEEEYSACDEFEDEYDEDDEEYEDEIEEKSERQLKKEMKRAAKLEKKEMLKKEKAAKKMKKTSKDEFEDDFENDEDDFDDSDDFEMQIFDLDEDKK